jgi:galactonate dehydratase
MPAAAFVQGLETAVENNAQSSMPSDLEITNTTCGFIRGGHGLFVKIHTNQGIWGCGEGADATPGTYHLVKMFRRRIEDESPLSPHRLFEQVREAGFFEGAQSGIYVAVLTAIETALWDLAGQSTPPAGISAAGRQVP